MNEKKDKTNNEIPKAKVESLEVLDSLSSSFTASYTNKPPKAVIAPKYKAIQDQTIHPAQYFNKIIIMNDKVKAKPETASIIGQVLSKSEAHSLTLPILIKLEIAAESKLSEGLQTFTIYIVLYVAV